MGRQLGVNTGLVLSLEEEPIAFNVDSESRLAERLESHLTCRHLRYDRLAYFDCERLTFEGNASLRASIYWLVFKLEVATVLQIAPLLLKGFHR